MSEVTMKELLKKAEASMSDHERRILGVGVEDDRGDRMRKKLLLSEGVLPVQGIESDGEVMLSFENWEDAQTLYSFLIESGLVVPGEIKLTHVEGQNTVHFFPEVCINKPEVLQAALVAYEDLVVEEDENEDEYWSLAEEVTKLVDLRRGIYEATVSGAPADSRGNPFHTYYDGKFSNSDALARAKKGSWSDGKRKDKVTGTGKDKSGRVMVKFGSTSHPCGRDARAKGMNKRCWDGKKIGGAAMVKALGGRRRRSLQADLDMSDLISLSEMKQYLDDMKEIIG